MSVRRFNYTQRKRILHSDTSIVLVRQGEGVEFDAHLQLSAYELPGSARVVVEAYRQTNQRRFAFGAAAKPAPKEPTRLDGFPDVDALLFRVKVIDSDTGILLAEADRIKPRDPDGGDRPSLLGVRSEHLSGEAWMLDFSGANPVLVVEKQYGPYQTLLASPHFRWLVLPQIFRALLQRALDEDFDDQDGEEEGWQASVVRHATILSGTSVPDEGEGDDREQWVTSAVRAFCRLHGLAQKYHSDVFGGGES